jgi:predicted transcriptional regulator
MFMEVLMDQMVTYQNGTKMQFTDVLDNLTLSYKISQKIIDEMAHIEQDAPTDDLALEKRAKFKSKFNDKSYRIK